jgi:hypothetical protein
VRPRRYLVRVRYLVLGRVLVNHWRTQIHCSKVPALTSRPSANRCKKFLPSGCTLGFGMNVSLFQIRVTASCSRVCCRCVRTYVQKMRGAQFSNRDFQYSITTWRHFHSYRQTVIPRIHLEQMNTVTARVDSPLNAQSHSLVRATCNRLVTE